MQTDRRGFMGVLAGTAAWLAGGSVRAAEPAWTSEIHQQTRNTLLGPVGRKWWPATRKTRRTKAYAGRERIALPAPASPGVRSLADVIGDDRGAVGFAGEALGLADLSRLLHFTNGVTDPPMLRAAPSAGALYAGEIYLVAERVTGLESGVYYYLPPSHALVRIRQGPGIEVVRHALERPGQIASAPVVLLLTNVFGRYGWRYANRGYRYALIDTGHIGENLRLVARSAGLVDTALPRFHDERLNELLGIDGRQEAVCAVHAVGHPGKGTTSPMLRTFMETKNAPASWGDTERYHASTRLAEGAPGSSKQRVRTPPRRNAVETLRPEMGVEDSIRNRRSALRFEDQTMQRDALEWILDAAVGHSALAPAGELELLLAVHRVAAVDPGLYRYEPDEARLVALRKADLRRRLVRTCLGQDKAGSCAVAFFGIGHLRHATETLGDRMYRDLLIEAGAIGQRIYLAAEAAGLAARNLAAFRDDALNRLLDLEGGEHAVLHLTLAGREA
jgi:SagB-type dehydrogenase family enzyme